MRPITASILAVLLGLLAAFAFIGGVVWLAVMTVGQR